VGRTDLNALALSGLLARSSGLVLSSYWLALFIFDGVWLALNF
jgi:hypothetical protein